MLYATESGVGRAEETSGPNIDIHSLSTVAVIMDSWTAGPVRSDMDNPMRLILVSSVDDSGYTRQKLSKESTSKQCSALLQVLM